MNINPANVKIILAEDAKTMRKIEVKILNSLGYTDILEAEDGLEAKKLLQNRKGVSLVISDWNMPNMGGDELLIWMRTKSKKFSKIPFIMATAQSDKAQVNKAKEAGATALVAKPFTADELQVKIEQALDPQKSTNKYSGRKAIKKTPGKTTLRVAHLPITDHLLLGLVKDKISSGAVKPKFFGLETTLMGGWNPVAEAIENGDVDAAFMLAPIAMDLFAHDVPINTVLLAHRGGSIMVRSAKGGFTAPCEDFFRKQSFLLPHKLSVHHMLSHMFFKGVGLNGSLDKGEDVDVNFEVVAPAAMPTFLAENDNVAGFMVAEPIGSKAINMGAAKKQFMTNELWPHHPCCVVVFREDFIKNCPDSTKEFVALLVKAGEEIANNVKHAAGVGVKFLDPAGKLGLKEAILEKVITDKNGIRWDNLYPDANEFDTIRDYMSKELNVLKKIDPNKFINYHFADYACKKTKSPSPITLPPSDKELAELLNRDQDKAKEQVSLSQLLFEKGIPTPANINPEQLQSLVDKQDRLVDENKKLRIELTDLKNNIIVRGNKAKDLFKQGVQYLKDGQMFEAAGCFNAQLVFEPDNVKALNNLAVIYFEMEMHDKAQKCFENILKIEPDNNLAKENLMTLVND